MPPACFKKPQRTPSPISHLPPEVVEYLITCIIWSCDIRTDLQSTFCNITLVCHSWSSLARRLEFLRLRIGPSYEQVKRVVDRVEHVRRHDCPRVPTEELILDPSNFYGGSIHFGDILKLLPLTSVRKLHLGTHFDWYDSGVQAVLRSSPTPGVLFPSVESLYVGAASPEMLRDSVLACVPSQIRCLSVLNCEIVMEQPISPADLSMPDLRRIQSFISAFSTETMRWVFQGSVSTVYRINDIPMLTSGCSVKRHPHQSKASQLTLTFNTETLVPEILSSWRWRTSLNGKDGSMTSGA